MRTLAELESLPELGRWPDSCMCCGKPNGYVACEVIVYRAPDGSNVTFDEARTNPAVDEVTTAHVCMDCNESLYAS